MKTLCGKCGKETSACTCAEIVPAGPPPGAFRIEPPPPRMTISTPIVMDGELPAFEKAMDEKLAEHRVTPETKAKRKLCPVCEKLGSTFGCTKCNAGPTNIRW